MLEEEVKLKVSKNYFSNFDTTRILSNIDYCISENFDKDKTEEFRSYYWAECKSYDCDLRESLTQLILTIGKQKEFTKNIPPKFVGSFDPNKICFVKYNFIQDIFFINDFNWNITPSDHSSKEFSIVYEKLDKIFNVKKVQFNYQTDKSELETFIKDNFNSESDVNKIKIDNTNYIYVYNKWLSQVKDSIKVDWNLMSKNKIYETDFFIADLISQNKITLDNFLYITLNKDRYELDKKLNNLGLPSAININFNDRQVSHNTFWNKYENVIDTNLVRYIIDRRDKLLTYSIRMKTGAYYTPPQWVKLSQEYLTRILGDNWQDEYYIWDCASGTGNLLKGLTNPRNIFASTLEDPDVNIIKSRIDSGELSMIKDNVFQFDFLNDEISDSKVPDKLREILVDEEKRKKLLIYINPPYGAQRNKRNDPNLPLLKPIDFDNMMVYKRYPNMRSKELSNLFISRIRNEFGGCKLGLFAQIALLTRNGNQDFIAELNASLDSLFVIPSYSFDNVTGSFPIGFYIFDLSNHKPSYQMYSDVFALDYTNNIPVNKGKILWKQYDSRTDKSINDWYSKFRDMNDQSSIKLGYGWGGSRDFDHFKRRASYFSCYTPDWENECKNNLITDKNLFEHCIYHTVQATAIENWVTHNFYLMYPTNTNFTNIFKLDCMIFSILNNKSSSQNSITTVNHFIPFSEQEVDSKVSFQSNYIYQLIQSMKSDLSQEAINLLDKAHDLYKFYLSQPDHKCDNPTVRDIQLHFQGTNEKGHLRVVSASRCDPEYMKVYKDFKEARNVISWKLSKEVEHYGFIDYQGMIDL